MEIESTQTKQGTLYLIPTPLTAEALQTIPTQVIQVIHATTHFVVEDLRTARRFIKATNPPYRIESLELREFSKHDSDDVRSMLAPLKEGHDLGVMSEAGCPGIADPGSALVFMAHEMGIRVVPLTGPSSIILTLMASGMNGQRFQFHGYLSPKKDQLATDIRRLEEVSRKDRATQIFIETPYRNLQVMETAFKVLMPSTIFCIAANLTDESEFIRTMPISEWRKTTIPQLHKCPAVFCIEAQ